MRRLKGGLPRRFKDHRRREAHEYREAYEVIAERYPPRDRLAARITAVAADLFLDYQAQRRSKRGTASARRKTAGLVLGALRAVREGVNGQGKPEEIDLAAELAKQGDGS